MAHVNRLLVSLDMLSQDLGDELQLTSTLTEPKVSDHYLELLAQYTQFSELLAQRSSDLTERNFTQLIQDSGMCLHLVNKNMLLVQNKLLTYVLEYYSASRKADQIRNDDFSEQAEVRFDLLTTRAIKSKSQFKTVARELAKDDYTALQHGMALAKFDWQWETLS